MEDDQIGKAFGRHVRSLRQARALTQDRLAERSALSVDTVRRLEYGAFSPSLDTLRKLCRGLGLTLSTLFESFEIGDRDEQRELVDLLVTRSPWEIKIVTRLTWALLESLDELSDEFKDN